ncbi:hypothetical protein CARUB_v10002211mg [Capsella rubella]|uniref:Cystatin domain-containing protein n=1 Tax=Capsella rubella TaxID=81985 RepID=R0GXX4_9BRAS|nr:hypothetical protein CARUB_v10002211mg [Capsella rubella]
MPYPDMEKANKHYRIYKRQIIESKGFYAEREFSLFYNYKSIFSIPLELEALEGKTFRQFWEDMVHVCLQKHKQDKDLNVEFVEVVRGNFHGGPRSKSYITFMAREKPDGPLVEYQAKSMLTLDGKMHPILCRPSPIPKLPKPIL